jgi:hypothetical protein
LAIPEPWTLSLDCRNGKWVFNILMLGVVHQGGAIPLAWCWLDKRGNSHTQERLALFERCLEHFGQRELAGLMADRELVGKD